MKELMKTQQCGHEPHEVAANTLQGRIPLDLDRESLAEAESLLASCA